jgi:hypothetical protein
MTHRPVSRSNRRGNPCWPRITDYIVGLSLADVDAAVAHARDYLRSVGYRARGGPRSRLTQCHRSDLPAYGNSAPTRRLFPRLSGRRYQAQICQFGAATARPGASLDVRGEMRA